MSRWWGWWCVRMPTTLSSTLKITTCRFCCRLATYSSKPTSCLPLLGGGPSSSQGARNMCSTFVGSRAVSSPKRNLEDIFTTSCPLCDYYFSRLSQKIFLRVSCRQNFLVQRFRNKLQCLFSSKNLSRVGMGYGL